MSFIQGETLQDHLNYIPGGKIPLEEVLKIGTELCSVLHYLHTYQPPIIFRDLKPSNIMRDKNGHIYLIDFGIARHFKPGQEKDTASYATVGYAAPEQYGRAQTTPRSDIYSLGATLYYLISGYAPSQSPFRLPPLQSLAPTLPLRLTGLITHMLDLEENRRPPDMMAVKQELQAITSSPAIPGKKKTPAGQPSSGAAPQMAGKPAKARTAHPIQLKKILARAFAVLSSVLCLIGLGLAIGGTGTAWYVYFGSYYQDISSGNTVPTLITSYIIVLLDMGSLILLLGFFTLYIPWTKNLSIATMTPISTRRKTIAKVGVFLGCILLIWGIWGWAHASPYFYNSSNNTDRTFDSSPYIYPALGFALIALIGIFIILATTMRSFGLSHTKSKKEMAQRITTILATFTLLFGTTFLLPETVVVAIICFLIGGGVLIATQLEQ